MANIYVITEEVRLIDDPTLGNIGAVVHFRMANAGVGVNLTRTGKAIVSVPVASNAGAWRTAINTAITNWATANGGHTVDKIIRGGDCTPVFP